MVNPLRLNLSYKDGTIPPSTPPRCLTMKRSRSLDFSPNRPGSVDYNSMEEAFMHKVSSTNSLLAEPKRQYLRRYSSKGDLSRYLQGQPRDDFGGLDYLQSEVAPESRMRRLMRTMTVGRISVLILLLFTSTDLIFNVVHAQMDAIDSPVYYDALSADVIRPAFSYRRSSHAERPFKSSGLGSAAIASVTEALSPILPFAGGLDLRREDYWTNGLFGSVSSVYQQVREAFAAKFSDSGKVSVLSTPRGGSTLSSPTMAKKARTVRKYESVLSAPKPFLSVDEISSLTLKDVATAFEYAVEATKKDFNKNKLFKGVLPRAKKAVEAMSDAASRSRGKDVMPAVTNSGATSPSGDVDALLFCAAMRIFAEWRVVRQVPEGYKGYAVGMSLGQKDIVSNIAKLESAVHSWIDNQKDLLDMQEAMDYGSDQASCFVQDRDGKCLSEVRSPTLRDVLEFEIDMKVHDKLPRLKEKSAAMGLLWVRRQLHYQTAIFANVVSDKYSSAKDAVTAAYSTVYDKYHGWAVQKIFNYSFQAAPEDAEIYKCMNPHRLKEVQHAAKSHTLGQHSLSGCEGNAPATDMNPFERFGNHVAQEWDKFASSIVETFGGAPRDGAYANHVRGGCDNSAETAMETAIEGFIANEMKKDAFENIEEYLKVAKPLLLDLASLIDELNMNDPTKV